MKLEKKPFTTKGRLDKRLWYYPLLKKLNLTSFKRITEHFIHDKKFIPIKIENLDPGKLQSLNHSIAWELNRKRLISDIELTKQVPLNTHTKLLSTRTIRLCSRYGMLNMGAVYERCIQEKDSGFSPVAEKKFTITANYQLASLLNNYKLLSEEKLMWVERPYWKLIVPVWEEFGNDFKKYLHEYNYPWSEITKEIICRSLARRYRYNRLIHDRWGNTTLRKLVLHFTRQDHHNNLVIYTKGHTGPDPKEKDFFAEHGPKAFIEIRTFLEKIQLLPPPSQEEKDRRWVEENE